MKPAPHDEWRVCYWLGAALVALMVALHLAAGMNAAGVSDSWRDMYWASAIAHGERFPLGGPPIYGILQLGPWWFYLLALPLWLTGQLVAIPVLVQLLAASKYFLAWRLGNRALDPRFGLAFAAAFTLAGWSTIPLYFPTHTALIEPALLLLAASCWRCRARFGLPQATGFGLAATLCLLAHPATAMYVAGAGLMIGWWHRDAASVARIAYAAGLAFALLLLPPLLQGDAAAQSAAALQQYAQQELGGNWWARFPGLLANMLAGGAWHGLLLLTQWRLEWVEVASGLFLACVVLALFGGWRARRRERRIAMAMLAAAALFLAQLGFLLALRPVTPMWMASSAVPPLAMCLALGWYGWLTGAGAERVVGGAGLALFVAISLVPFGYFLRQLDAARIPLDANPFFDLSTRATRFELQPVVFTPIRKLQSIGSALCRGGVLHGRLAMQMETSLALPVRAACEPMPELRFGGREGEGPHWAGFELATWRALGIAPERTVEGMGISARMRALAPERGGRPVALERMQVNPNASGEQAAPLLLTFAARGDEVLALTNRFRFVAPLTERSVTAAGRPALLVRREAGSSFYRCAACAGADPVDWRFELDGVASNLDLIALTPSQRVADRAPQ